MRHVRMLGLCLVAAFALAVVFAAGSASAAEPEWAGCVKLAKAKGNYTEAKCETVAEKEKTVKGKKVKEPDHKGAYEFESGQAATCVEQKDGNFTESGCNTVSGKTKVKKVKGKVVSEEFVPNHKGKWEATPADKFESNGGAGILKQTAYTCELENEEIVQAPREDCVGDPSNHVNPETGNPESHQGYERYGVVYVECESEHATGEASGEKEVRNISVRFKGCSAFGFPATTHGLPAGEIQVNTLKGELGYLAPNGKANHEVGVLLEPATPGGEFASFETLEGFLHVHVGVGNATEGAYYEGAKTPGDPTGHDGIISPITPVGKMTHEFTQDYRAEVSEEGACPENDEWDYSAQPYHCEPFLQYQNVPSSFEGGRLEALEAYLEPEGRKLDWNSAGQEVENVNTVNGEAEIKG